ncbi:MAG TPA: hypothetical protein VMV73_01075 [Candidatus Dormibacteraeota bacterium]|nr:hypothetical protein [Candidatus Dormibacteraeota bacterium]
MKVLGIVIAILCFVMAILTATGVAKFAPILGLNGVHHVKHTIMYAVLGVFALIWVRFQANSSR